MQYSRNENLDALNSQSRRCPKCGLQVAESALVCPQDGTPIFEAPGTKLSENYEFLSVSGWGGMSIIYKARHRRSNQIVAIKMMHSLMLTEQSLKRFQQEADAISSLRHPNIISVHEFGLSDQGQPYMVMDFIEGENLSDVIQRKGSLSLDECLHRFIQLCDALQHAHDIGILHRDLKPSNIMLSSKDGNFEDTRIVDFGIAKLVNDNEDGGQHLTKTGELFGSPLYMSPEQCRGAKIDSRTDIYSMGCMMYETLTGQPPFKGTSVMETIMKQINEAAPSLSDGKKDSFFSPKLEHIIRKTLAKDPNDRFQTMNDLELALMQVQSKSPDTAIITKNDLPSLDVYKGSFKIGAIAAVALVLLLIASYFSWQSGVWYGRSLGNATAESTHKRPTLFELRNDRASLSADWKPELLTNSFLLSNYLYSGSNLVIEKLDLNGAAQISSAALIHVNELKSLTEVDLDDTKIDDDGLKMLATLPNIETISLRNTDITDKGLSYLVAAKKLKCLYLDRTNISNGGCASLAKIPTLQVLHLGSTRVDDSGVAYLKSLPLSVLYLPHTPITDIGVQDIATITTLSDLKLQDTNLTDAGLKNFKDLRNLTKLNLDQNPISDIGAGYLASLDSLEVLYLNQTNINDQGLAKLAKLGSLKELRLDRTLVTDAGMKEVPRFANLGKIVLKNDAITDRGLDALSKAPKLISIDLDNTDITDSGLRNLEKDCRFSWFGVGACRQVSPAAIRHFLKSVPKCAIGDWRDYTQDKKSRFYLKAK